MSSFNNYYSAIATIEDILKKDLIGPVSDDEEWPEPPLGLYSMGILWPQRTDRVKNAVEDVEEAVEKTDVEHMDIHTDSDTIDDIDDDLEGSNGKIDETSIFRPSAMAITSVISEQESFITIRFKYATYVHTIKEITYEKRTRDSTGVERVEIKTRKTNNYSRKEGDILTLVYNFKEKRIVSRQDIPKNIEIEAFVRETLENGDRLVTVSVKNRSVSSNDAVAQNTSALFQCQLSVESDKGFSPISKNHVSSEDAETQALEMLYRDVRNYASGHGCSVKWEVEGGSVCKIESEFMPVTELLQTEPVSIPELSCFNMQYWGQVDRKRGCDELDGFIKHYEDWLFSQKIIAKTLTEYSGVASERFAEIEQCIGRLRKGVECLRSNNEAYYSFIYMNEAMLLQRVNFAKTKGHIVELKTVSWYPFQLAYILQIIPDIIDPEGSGRDLVDLLWFPTGGGKTEAYLGMAAFVIFYRRLVKGEAGAGVTTIMRYTLRLLTAQQFERAASLICACEFLRNKHSILGGQISIGLWVGMDVTPNSLEIAKEKIEEIKEGRPVYQGNPMQIYKCPFCGADLDIGDYKIGTTMKICCSNINCVFAKGLPIYVIDEDIYHERPTLILSTVDKFARIVWEERTVAIFGSDGKTSPPELIIQDELHLISGPLGSIDGLYEIAIDELCTKDNIKPKIIASTATARNSANQIKALYNRGSFQFPPSGIDINNSFFTHIADRSRKPARKYIGICDTGGSMLDIFVRVYGCMFFAVNYLKALGVEDNVIDQYFTIVGYFNSLKDLGSSATIIMDRVETYSKSLQLHKFGYVADEVGLKEIIIQGHTELTSRKSSQEIRTSLEELEISYPDEKAYSYALASNMLSVGVDVGRLGVMTVYNQPKTTSEYIQATSRVGRSRPGIVLTLHNWMRSRDKSHYEQFNYFHQTYYKNVEPTSVTPFSFRALEKALHSVYVAILRHKIPGLRGNADVINFLRDNNEVKRIRRSILNRIKAIDAEALDYAEEWLTDFEKAWERNAQVKSGNFSYSIKNKAPSIQYTLLVEAEKENLTDFPSTLNSLRNVDASSNVFILNRDTEGFSYEEDF